MAGQSYVVFGSNSGFGASFNLSTLNGSNGFAINGIAASDSSGFSRQQRGGTSYGDGFDDLIIGASCRPQRHLFGQVMWCLAATVALLRASTFQPQRQQRLCD
jgi:hypothetical protein